MKDSSLFYCEWLYTVYLASQAAAAQNALIAESYNIRAVRYHRYPRHLRRLIVFFTATILYHGISWHWR